AVLTVSAHLFVRHTTKAWSSKDSRVGLNTIIFHPCGAALSNAGAPEASEMGKESETCIFSAVLPTLLARPPPVATSDPLHRTCASPVSSGSTKTAGDRKTEVATVWAWGWPAR